MPDDFSFKVNGLDKLLAAFGKAPREVVKALQNAAAESSKEIIETQGLKNYPPMTKANKPPTPYYVRGYGTQYKSYLKPTSENMKQKWYVRREGIGARIGNPVSYAKWVHGDEQADAMAKIGWRKLVDVARDKLPKIQRIYQRLINMAIKKAGFK